MPRADLWKLLRVLVIADLVRTFADYESYSTFIGFFLDEVLDHYGDGELVEMCCETIIQ